MPEVHYHWDVSEPSYVEHRFYDNCGRQVEFGDICEQYYISKFRPAEVSALGFDPEEYDAKYRDCCGDPEYSEWLQGFLKFMEADPLTDERILERARIVYPEAIATAKAAQDFISEFNNKTAMALEDAWGGCVWCREIGRGKLRGNGRIHLASGC